MQAGWDGECCQCCAHLWILRPSRVTIDVINIIAINVKLEIKGIVVRRACPVEGQGAGPVTVVSMMEDWLSSRLPLCRADTPSLELVVDCRNAMAPQWC